MKHGGGGRPGRGGRQVTEDEAELWRQLAHSIDKVKVKPRVSAHRGGADAADFPAPSAPARQAGQVRQRSSASAATLQPAPAPPVRQSPAPAEFDRRTLRQVAAGKVTIDSVLDLHGLHQDTAQARLRAFLVSSQAKGHRMVLVITGKGGGGRVKPNTGDEGFDSARRGVLRRSVPQWLEEPEFRAVVLGYASAGVRHGGDGALYVRLRKAREA